MQQYVGEVIGVLEPLANVLEDLSEFGEPAMADLQLYGPMAALGAPLSRLLDGPQPAFPESVKHFLHALKQLVPRAAQGERWRLRWTSSGRHDEVQRALADAVASGALTREAAKMYGEQFLRADRALEQAYSLSHRLLATTFQDLPIAEMNRLAMHLESALRNTARVQRVFDVARDRR